MTDFELEPKQTSGVGAAVGAADGQSVSNRSSIVVVVAAAPTATAPTAPAGVVIDAETAKKDPNFDILTGRPSIQPCGETELEEEFLVAQSALRKPALKQIQSEESTHSFGVSTPILKYSKPQHDLAFGLLLSSLFAAYKLIFLTIFNRVSTIPIAFLPYSCVDTSK